MTGKSLFCVTLVACGGVDSPVEPTSSALRATPSAHDFGDVVHGGTITATVQVINVGAATASALAVALAGDDAGAFSITSGGCAGMALDSAQSCSIGVRFDPGSVGKKHASLNITSAEGLMAAVDLSGNGLAAGALTIAPETADFGTVAVASSAKTTLTITNSGSSASGALALRFDGTSKADLVLAEDGCSGATLASGASCTVQVTLTPSVAGSQVASLKATAAPGGSTAAALSGTGQGQLKLKVTGSGSGAGVVTSYPAGLMCDTATRNAMASFTFETVILVATPSPGSTMAALDGCDEMLSATMCTVRLDGAQESVAVSFAGP
jgi:hypothetical protein